MDDLESRYSRLFKQVADLFPEDQSLFAFLVGSKVNREEWNARQGRGEFFFEENAHRACVERIELIADDTDGAVIEIVIHITGERGNWGEWSRLDGRSVLRWPPLSVLPKSRHSRRNRKIEGHSSAGGSKRTELDSRYHTFLRQFANLYPGDEQLRTQLQAVSIRREDWDEGRGGGHLYFEGASSTDAVDDDTFDALADDTDGAAICIILHFVGGLLNWGEWFRWDGEPVQCWPPPSLRTTR